MPPACAPGGQSGQPCSLELANVFLALSKLPPAYAPRTSAITPGTGVGHRGRRVRVLVGRRGRGPETKEHRDSVRHCFEGPCSERGREGTVVPLLYTLTGRNSGSPRKVELSGGNSASSDEGAREPRHPKTDVGPDRITEKTDRDSGECEAGPFARHGQG